MAVGATVVLSSQHQTGRRRIFCVHRRSSQNGYLLRLATCFIGKDTSLQITEVN